MLWIDYDTMFDTLRSEHASTPSSRSSISSGNALEGMRPCEEWLGALDDFRNWLIHEAA
jgi:hypothetical protein